MNPAPMTTASPLILTLKLDAVSFDAVNYLREQHFPPERNWIPAHITLFHALPAEQEANIRQTLQTLCSETEMLALNFPQVRFLGRGVAIEVESQGLLQVRDRLHHIWREWLTPQDQQGYRPHITIQNKVMPDAARQLYHQLASTWKPLQARGEGLLLWRYCGGPWERVAEFSFNAASRKN